MTFNIHSIELTYLFGGKESVSLFQQIGLIAGPGMGQDHLHAEVR